MYDIIISETLGAFRAGELNCAEAVLYAFCRASGQGEDFSPRIATPFGGGMCGTQGVCGALTGSLMAIGLMQGRELGGDKLPAYQAGKEFISWFHGAHGCDNCRVLTDCDMADPAQASAFRKPGGKHDTLCVNLVESCVRKLLAEYPHKAKDPGEDK